MVFKGHHKVVIHPFTNIISYGLFTAVTDTRPRITGHTYVLMLFLSSSAVVFIQMLSNQVLLLYIQYGINFRQCQENGPVGMHVDNTQKKVAVLFTGKLENGEIFEATPGDHPLVFTLGLNIFFPAIEQALAEMSPGESRTLTLPPEQAYGPHHEHLVQTLDRSVFGDKIDPKPGMVLSLNMDSEDGSKKVPATVTEVADDTITVDYNHPLAGKTVIYDLTLYSYMD